MELQLGIYRHYKGGLYEVISLAKDANNEGRDLVLYKTLGESEIFYVRDRADFESLVHANVNSDVYGETASVEDNDAQPRFYYFPSS